MSCFFILVVSWFLILVVVWIVLCLGFVHVFLVDLYWPGCTDLDGMVHSAIFEGEAAAGPRVVGIFDEGSVPPLCKHEDAHAEADSVVWCSRDGCGVFE